MVLSLFRPRAFVGLLIASMYSMTPPERGVIVEAIQPGSQGARAGLEAGDTLRVWERGAERGRLESPFDLAIVEAEQAPRGAVTLRGFRNGEPRTWKLEPGDWRISSRPALSGTEDSRSAASIWRLWRAAESLAGEQQWVRADESYRKAIDLAVTDSPQAAAHLLRTWGASFHKRSKPDEAERCYRRAIDEERKLWNESLAIAGSLSAIGVLARQRGDLAQAESYQQQALAIRKKLAPGSLEVAASLNNLGIVARNRGRLGDAEEHYSEALAIVERLAPESLNLAEISNNLGNLVQDRGDFAAAQQYFQKALAIKQKLAPASRTVAATLNNLGNASYYRGDLAEAERYFRQSHAIFEKIASGSIQVAQSLHNLANVVVERGDVALAEHYHLQALKVEQALAPESLDVADSLNSLGVLANQRGEPGSAGRYLTRALATYNKLAPGSLNSAEILDNLGSVSASRGDWITAEQYHRQALAVEDKVAPGSLFTANTLTRLAAAIERRGDPAVAEDYYRQAVDIFEQVSPETGNHAKALYAVGRILSRKRQFDAAAAYFERAITAFESQTTRLGGPEEVRAGFRAERSAYYRDYIELLLSGKQNDRAFEVLERSRARSLLSMLAERDLVFSTEISWETERARKRNAAEYDRASAELASLGKDIRKIESLRARLRELEGERARIRDEIKRQSPRLAALRYPEPLDLAGARRILDPGTVMLSYSAGPNETNLFVVQPPGVEPGLSVLRLPIGEAALRRSVQDFRRLLQDPRRNVLLERSSRALYDLLVRPAESHIHPSLRVLIIPDGPLHVLPFGALMRANKRYLVEWKPLHTAASANVYAELRKSPPAAGSARTELAAFGDPLYVGAGEGLRSLRIPSEEPLPRLRFSRKEVNSIAALYPSASRVYAGADATEERAKSLAGTIRYLHFATHAVIDERFPMNSALVLSTPTPRAARGENGYLQAWEIFEQVRWDAELVVLSACETGLGKELRNEGLIGLTRALHYAGARSVVASLWGVEDRRTAHLMRRFYESLRQGTSKDEALRAAQIKMLLSGETSHPFYWAAFSLTGYWR